MVQLGIHQIHACEKGQDGLQREGTSTRIQSMKTCLMAQFTGMLFEDSEHDRVNGIKIII